MRRNAARTIAAVCAVVALTGTGTSANEFGMSAERMRRNIETLASDRFGGRAPGSPGEDLTVDFLAGRLRDLGYEPGNPDGSYTQGVPLMSVTCTNSPNLLIRAVEGDYERSLDYGPEFMGWTLRQVERTEVDAAELVFAGYGTIAPEYDWDDFKGVDVSGKIIVLLVGDPPTRDESLFGGKAMTYYGRWTYKYEEAARVGAAGAIIIHNTAAAGYPWAVVENSWKGEQFDVVREDRGMSRCALESWITEPVARDLFQRAGRSYDEAVRAAAQRDFQPFSLGFTGTVEIRNSTYALESRNVVARLPGNDPKLSDEHIIYMAHWDHLGVGNVVDGDSIYNGALDNASGVAGILEVAAAFAGKRDEIKRSILIFFPTAEESGLLGAKYYTQFPLYPLTSTVATINIDGVNMWGRTKDMVVVGFGQSDLDRYLEDAVTAMDRYLLPDSEPEKGHYYRSDHFAFARRGVPALYADSGVEFRGRPEGWGMERRNEYVRERYHKPQDEYDSSWNLEGAIEDMTALFLVGYKLAVSDRYPRWSDTSEFKKVREESMKGSR
jgi:Zn-dependent M28 family amino/carboxypeptidase